MFSTIQNNDNYIACFCTMAKAILWQWIKLTNDALVTCSIYIYKVLMYNYFDINGNLF